MSDIISDGDLSGDLTSSVVDCRDKTNCRFQLSGTNTDTPVGVIRIEGSDDPLAFSDPDNAQWTPLTLPLGCAHGTGFTAPTEGVPEIDWDGTNPLNLAIDLDSPLDFMRVLWVNTSDGSGALLQARGKARR